MKKTVLTTALALAALMACQPAQQEETKASKTTQADSTEVAVNGATVQDPIGEMADIDVYRSSIESSLDRLNKQSMSTETLRDQIKQKWSTIDFYTNEAGELVRVKTYPHSEISKRTEEFYFQNGNLVNAIVEDDGSEKGKEAAFEGKLYYYATGEVIGEKNMTEEEEYNIRKSDGERLLQEAREYQVVFASMEK